MPPAPAPKNALAAAHVFAVNGASRGTTGNGTQYGAQRIRIARRDNIAQHTAGNGTDD
jgi:hypothetical protein